MNKYLRLILSGIFLLGMMVVGTIFSIQWSYAFMIRPLASFTNAMPTSTIMILGASRTGDGPSDALSDRLKVGAKLFAMNTSSVILITGDDGAYRSNEIEVMKQTLVEREHVPISHILIDGHGYRTYESCRNAKLAGLHNLIIVTQRFHAARAGYLCSKLGLTNISVVTADLQPYQEIVYYWMREALATFKAYIDLNFYTPSSPVPAT